MLRGEAHTLRNARSSAPRVGAWLLVFAAALALRLWVAATSEPGQRLSAPESVELDTVAWNLARGIGFSLTGPTGPSATAATAPVTPWLVSLVYRWAGHRAFAATLMFCVIGALVPLMVGGLASATFGSHVGRVATWLTVIDPLLLRASSRLGSAPLITALLVLALIATASWVKTPRPARALGVGILWAAAAGASAGLVFLPLVICAWAWVPLGLTVTAGDRNRQVALVAVGFLLGLGPWLLRDAWVFRAPVPITTGAGRALLAGNNPVSWDDPARRGRPIDPLQDEPYASLLRFQSEIESDRLAFNEAWRWMSHRLPEWPAAAAAKLGRLWSPSGSPTEADRSSQRLSGWRRVPWSAWSLLVFPLALWGIVRTFLSPRRWYQSLGLLVILYFCLGAVVFYGEPRLRMPIEPLVLLFTAAGFEDLRRRVRTRARGLRVIEGRRRAAARR